MCISVCSIDSRVQRLIMIVGGAIIDVTLQLKMSPYIQPILDLKGP